MRAFHLPVALLIGLASPACADDDVAAAQRVHIVDGGGVAWEALYTLEQQPDGSLKITGCTLLKAGQAV